VRLGQGEQYSDYSVPLNAQFIKSNIKRTGETIVLKVDFYNFNYELVKSAKFETFYKNEDIFFQAHIPRLEQAILTSDLTNDLSNIRIDYFRINDQFDDFRCRRYFQN
jgi:hypothetical protein